jgi:hypothetical protein
MSDEKQAKGNDKKAKGNEQGAADGQLMGGVAERRANKIKWTLARCKKFARRFHNEAEWQAGAPSSYKSAVAHGWMKDCKTVFIKENVVSLTKVNQALAKKIQKKSA